MHEIFVTVMGRVASRPKSALTKSGHSVASFRLASTPRRFDREPRELGRRHDDVVHGHLLAGARRPRHVQRGGRRPVDRPRAAPVQRVHPRGRLQGLLPRPRGHVGRPRPHPRDVDVQEGRAARRPRRSASATPPRRTWPGRSPTRRSMTDERRRRRGRRGRRHRAIRCGPRDRGRRDGSRAPRLGVMAEFIYVMSKARKAHGDKVILDNVTLAFYPGAKIGVVGPNGAGKSTVLRIMAGLDHASNGEATLTAGYTVGILEQEPKLDETKTVLDNVREGVAETLALVERYNAIGAEMAEPDADYDALGTEMSKLQDEIDHRNAWDLDSQLEQAMDALRCPPRRRRRVRPVRRREAAGGPVQAPAAGARPAAARRADQPPRRGVRALARAAPGEVPRHRRRRHPRPVLPRQRRPVDPRARPRTRVPVRGQLLDLPRGQGRPHEGRGPEGRQAPEAAPRGAGVGALQRQGAPDEVQGAPGPLRGDGRGGRQDPQARLRGDPDPAGPAPGQRRRRDRRT